MMDKHKTQCLLAWQNKLIDIRLNINKERGVVTIRAVKYELGQSFKFSRLPTKLCQNTSGSAAKDGMGTDTLTFNCSGCDFGEILGSELVENLKRGFSHPCILLKLAPASKTGKRKKETFYLCLIQLNDSGFKLSGKCQLDISLYDHEVCFNILNESMVCYAVNDTIHFIRYHNQLTPQMFSTALADVLKSQYETYRNIRTLACGKIERDNCPFLLDKLHCDPFFEMVWLLNGEKENASESCDTDPWDFSSPDRSLAVSITVMQDNSLKYELLDGTDFLPNVYGSLVTKLQILRTYICESNINDRNYSPPVNRVNSCIQSEILVSTLSGQLLFFKNGDLKHCKTIEISKHGKFLCEQFENSIGLRFYAVGTKNDTIEVLEANTFEVKETFSLVSEALVGDFIGSGGDQLLIVSKEEHHSSPDKWKQVLLADFHTVNSRPSETQDTICYDKTEESVKTAVQALEGRLQASVTFVCGVQREYENKLRLIEQGIANLRQMSLGNETSHVILPGLMPLLGEDTPRSYSPSSQPQNDTVCVSEIWQKVFEDTWIVGLKLQNTSKSYLKSTKVSILPIDCDQPMESTTFFKSKENFAHHTLTPESDESVAPIPKIRKLESKEENSLLSSHYSLEPGSCVQVIVTMKLPSFCSGDSIAVSLMLSWRENQACNADTTSKGLENSKISKSVESSNGNILATKDSDTSCVSVGTVHITAQKVISGSITVKPSCTMPVDDTLIMDAVQRCYPLRVQSTYSMLGDLSGPLQRPLSFQQFTNTPSWINLDNGALNHVRIKVHSYRDPHCLNVSVYVRDEPQLLLLIHALYSALPDDVIILPCQVSNINNLAMRVLNEITAETDFVTKSKNSTHKKINDKEEAAANDSYDKDDVTKIRKKFLKKQKNLQEANDKELDED